MTVKELKQKLEKYPENMDVFMDERISDFRYGLLNSISVTKINFMEEPDGKVLSKDDVIVLSEY